MKKKMSDYLPNEVLANIFFKLPAKTVLDCRCVCKSWCSVVTNSNFISQYNKLSFMNSNRSLLILSHFDLCKNKEVFTLHRDDDSFNVENEHEELELPFDHGLSSYMVIGICYGLVCLLEISKAQRSPISIVIWNPSVGYSFKTFAIESPVGTIEQPYYGYGPSIRFNNGDDFVSSFGFGFDPKSNDYKVVRLVYRLEKNNGISNRVPEIVDILALSVGEWKKITESVPPYVIEERSWHVNVYGAVHWIGQCNGGYERSILKLVVVVFDLDEEVFKEFKLPDDIVREVRDTGEEENQNIFVGVINQSLALFHYFTHANRRFPPYYGCCIWVMKDYGARESWKKMFNVRLCLGVGKILGLRRNGEILLGTIHGWELQSLNPKVQIIRKAAVGGEPWSYCMDTYMECLLICKKVDGVVRMSTSFCSNYF